jgi:hypothetical protein
MAYPAPARWDSGAPAAAWYAVPREAGGTTLRVCETDGWSLVFQAQSRAQQYLELVGPQPDAAGLLVSRDDVPVNGAPPYTFWDARLLRALYAVARHAGAPADALTALSADAARGAVSASTLQTALWTAHAARRENVATDVVLGLVGTPDAYRLPAAQTLPPWNAPIEPVPVSFQHSCSLIQPPGALLLAPRPTWAVNPWVIVAVVGVAAVGAVVLTRRVPTQPLRKRR